MEWNNSVWVAGCLLFIFLFWKEIKRSNKSYLIARLVASALSVITLVCMALPVYYTERKKEMNREAVMLTDGYNPDSVLSFLKNRKGIAVISLDKNIQHVGSYQADYLADLSLLPEKYKDKNVYQVFGFGLAENVLEELKNACLSFHPNQLFAGITAIHWQQKIKAGEKLSIEGSYHNPTASRVKITLSRFGETFDSSDVAAGKDESFHLAIIPANEGRAVYSLSVISGSDTVEKETVPVQVEENKSLNICMLSSSPDFDTKFLKNDLSSQGFSVIARSRISKGKYATDYLNATRVPLDHLTASLLEKTDVLIADASELNVVPASDLAVIRAQVEQKGMGMIVKEDTLLKPPFLSFFPAQISTDSLQQIALSLLDTTDKMPALITDHPLFLKNTSDGQPIATDNKNHLYAADTLFGLGKIVFTTLPNTYRWALSGNENAYQHFWTTLLKRVARPSLQQESWSFSPLLPVINNLVEVRLQTNTAGIPEAQINGESVYLESNPDLPFLWSGRYYPKHEGWQTVIGLNGAIYYGYAYSKTQWQCLLASQKIEATRQYASQHAALTEKEQARYFTEKKEVPKIWFFILFTMSCAFLWSESKNIFGKK